MCCLHCLHIKIVPGRRGPNAGASLCRLLYTVLITARLSSCLTVCLGLLWSNGTASQVLWSINMVPVDISIGQDWSSAGSSESTQVKSSLFIYHIIIHKDQSKCFTGIE